MNYNYASFCVYLVCLFTACTDFNLNAPYKDVPVVYGILNYQDSIHYVKIYKGFQPKENGSAFIDAQNPDSIYYYNNITVVLEEYDVNDKRTSRPNIPLYITHDFERDSGIFYYKDERILYYTTENINKEMIYKIKITNKLNGNIIEGKTPIVGDFRISNISSDLNMLRSTSINFISAPNAAKTGYEIHVNFIYFEVEISTNKVIYTGKIEKNICPNISETFKTNNYGELYKEFVPTLYDDLAVQLKPNSNIVRYIGWEGSNGSCIEVEAWAAEESMVNFLLSNKPTNSFVQVNNIYTNLTASEGKVFGFLSSKVKTKRTFNITHASEDSLYFGSKTNHLGFRPWIEYNP